MSGIVGILHMDGSPLDCPLLDHSSNDQQLLETLTNFQTFRGPDARYTWVSGPVGLGHTLLSTTLGATSSRDSPERERERQPCSLDGETWIVADARVDARAELKARLQSHGAGDLRGARDAELILCAYRVWGEKCVEHLLGDFAFAIWDGRRRKLFCARDHIGVKSLYYARLGSLFIFSNTLDCIRQHPGNSDRLNELTIADFLIFEMPQDPEATAFADICRLPPAHTLTCEGQNISVRRYWELSVSTPIHYRYEKEYVEHFTEMLDTAVADRLPANNVGVWMSGGLDSPTIAASAKRVLLRDRDASGLRAYTAVFDRLIPHEERHYAGLVAKALNIPIEYQVDDDCRIFGVPDPNLADGSPFDRPDHLLPALKHSVWPDSATQQLGRIAGCNRVALTGFGADPMLACRITVHFRQLLKTRRFGKAMTDAFRFLSAEGRFSRLYLRTRWRLLRAPKRQVPSFPPWLNEEFEKKFALRDRWNQMNRLSVSRSNFRPEAHESTVAPFWSRVFESYDTGMTGATVEVCHPFFDLRLMSFLLALPPLPWCSDKELLRESARNVLPDAVRLRRKSPLSADPVIALLQKPESQWVDRFRPISELESYVTRSRIPAVLGEKDGWTAWIHLKPLSLNFWLRRVARSSIKTSGGLYDFKGARAC